MPQGAVYVGRRSRDGNPYRVGDDYSYYFGPNAKYATAQQCVELFRNECDAHRIADPQAFEMMLARLRGKDLACWCPLDQPCHADVLLELANAK
jgi:Domain of unknown function (DUF4326)